MTQRQWDIAKAAARRAATSAMRDYVPNHAPGTDPGEAMRILTIQLHQETLRDAADVAQSCRAIRAEFSNR